MKENTVSLVSFYFRGNVTYDIGEECWIFLVVQGVLEDTETSQLARRITLISDGEIWTNIEEVWVRHVPRSLRLSSSMALSIPVVLGYTASVLSDSYPD